MAVDFLVGRWTRPHKNLDLAACTSHRSRLERELGALDMALAHDEGWTTRWTVAGRPGADVEVAFVEPASPQTGCWWCRWAIGRMGKLAGTGSSLVSDPRRYRELGGVRFRTCSADGE